MSEFIDKYGRWHNKICLLGEPSSNNAWIFTAYAKMLGFEIPLMPNYECYLDCKRTAYPLVIDRHPGDQLPPMSRDEILGLVCLGYLPVDYLMDLNYWQFCNLDGFQPKSLWKINWFKALKAAWRIRNGHRNALWNEPDLWHLGFRLPPQDTWYVLRKFGLTPSPLHTIYFYLSSLITIRSKDESGKLILWMKLKDLKMENSWLYRKLNAEAAAKNYFHKEHPFYNANWK